MWLTEVKGHHEFETVWLTADHNQQESSLAKAKNTAETIMQHKDLTTRQKSSKEDSLWWSVLSQIIQTSIRLQQKPTQLSINCIQKSFMVAMMLEQRWNHFSQMMWFSSSNINDKHKYGSWRKESQRQAIWNWDTDRILWVWEANVSFWRRYEQGSCIPLGTKCKRHTEQG